VSELQFIRQDISNRRKQIAKREEEINQLLERIQEYLKPRQQKKEQELSKDNLPRENVPIWISGYLLHGIGRKQIELSEDRQNISKDKLEHQIDKVVDAIIQSYR
jgi:uncharacterized protein (DUF3084 family)